MRNTKLNDSFLALARELDIMEAKTPEDIYKSHLESGTRAAGNVDSAKANLAATFVNSFVNAGFGEDKLIKSPGEGQTKWIHRQKDEGIMAAAASLGMLLLWDVDGGTCLRAPSPARDIPTPPTSTSRVAAHLPLALAMADKLWPKSFARSTCTRRPPGY